MASAVASSSEPYDPSGKGKGRASPSSAVATDTQATSHSQDASLDAAGQGGIWRRSRARAHADRQSWDYSVFSVVAAFVRADVGLSTE